MVHLLANPRAKQVPGDQARVAQQPVDLFDRRRGDQSPRRRESLPDEVTCEARPRHHPERAIGQRQDTLGAQVPYEPATHELMNEIKLLLRCSHLFASPLIFRRTDRRIRNSGFFESRILGGFLKTMAASRESSPPKTASAARSGALLVTGRRQSGPGGWSNHLRCLGSQALETSGADPGSPPFLDLVSRDFHKIWSCNSQDARLQSFIIELIVGQPATRHKI